MSSDKKTIGILAGNVGALKTLVESGCFASELEAAKFAMAYAIKTGEKGGTADGAETKWNVGSVDPDGKLKTLLSAFYPDNKQPYRLIEYLINCGLSKLLDEKTRRVDVYGVLFAQ